MDGLCTCDDTVRAAEDTILYIILGIDSELLLIILLLSDLIR